MTEAPPKNATLYVRNLDEKQKIPALIEALREIFAEFGTIIEIIAKKSMKRKGQAFVVFESADDASDAIDSLQGFELFGRPMEIAYAKTRSDAIVKREDGEEALEQHKALRKAEKERKQTQEAAAALAARPPKRDAEDNLAERPAKSAKPTPGALQDDFLPPNKTLILRDFPADYTKEALTAVFARFPGFKAVRLVPGREGLAFAEYEDEVGSAVARDAMNGVKLGENTIRVTFQRQ